MTPEAFAWGRRVPLPVLMINAKVPLVCIANHRELREDWFDNATRTNAKACRSLFIFDDYATAMMGGEPYSDWN